MAMFTGIKAHMNVYVLGLGWAQVTRVLPDEAGFFVRIGSIERQFTLDGRVGGTGLQKVFWQDPIVAVPCQQQHLWLAYTHLSHLLYEELITMANAGFIPE